MDNKIKTADTKVKKYNDADTKKEGSPIETPYKYSDTRRKVVDIIIEEKSNEVIE